jgi:hypothetical protein|tara:strand:+ start:87 stop:356 length:270 start_codon:yes stop_codon:yes gene_type:complete
MSKQYRDNYDAIAWSRPSSVRSRRKSSGSTGITFMKDIEPFRSPLDGSHITTRSELREHEKKHNVRQIGNDWAGSERPANWDTMRNVDN